VDGNSFVLAGWDDLTREIEWRRRAVAEKLESERRAAQELEIAKHVQARLFPQGAAPLKTLDYAGICLQAREVGGDYYDFLSLGRERLGLVIGDISGKGIAAALLMANLQATLRSQCTMASDQPQRFLRSVNSSSTRIRLTALTPPSFLPNMTIESGAFAMRIAGMSLASSSGTTRLLNGFIPLAQS